jgi:tetratricopeptide (TPR) repeat protein
VHEPLHEDAIAEAERAIALNPNDVDNLFVMARALIFGGRAEEGADYVKKAMRLDPHYPAEYLSFLGLAQLCMGQLKEAASTLERAHKRNPELEVYPLVVTYAHLGREEEATDILAQYLEEVWQGRKILWGHHVREVLTFYPFKNETHTHRFAEGLYKSGLTMRTAMEAFPVDQHFASAYELMAYSHLSNVWLGLSTSPDQSVGMAAKLAQKAIAIEESRAEVQGLLGLAYLMKREYEKAIAEGERAVALDPNNPEALGQFAWILRFAGRPEEAVALHKKAVRLNPWPRSWQFLGLGMAYYMMRQYKEAISAFRKALDQWPENEFAYMGLAAAYTYLGREQDARAASGKVLELDPNFSLDRYATMLPFKNPDDRDQLINALRKAGLR